VGTTPLFAAGVLTAQGRPFPNPSAERHGGNSQERAQGWRHRQRVSAIRLILFDLDGTLFETDDEIVAQVAQALRPLARLFHIDARRTARVIVMNLEAWVNAAITLLDVLRLDRAAFWLADRAGRRLHASPDPQQYRLTPDSRALLASLHGRYRLGVVTTRSRAEAEQMLTATGIRSFFDVVVTRDDVPRLKPHPAPIRLAARELGIPPSATLVVGDTSVDVRAARAAGALAAAVLCGFGELDELEGADIILEKPADLRKWL